MVAVAPGPQRMGRRVVDACERHVGARHICELRIARQPSELGVVGADDAGVGGSALPEVEPAVAHHRTIRLVIADARQPLDDRRDTAVRADAQDAAAFKLTALGDIERAVGESDAVPGTVAAAALGDHGGAAAGFDTQ